MKTVTLQEAHAPYHIAFDDAPLSGEVVILEKDGQPVAAVAPMAEYSAFQAWRAAEKRQQTPQNAEAIIEREHAAFQRMSPALQKQYPGQVVAIHASQVVAVGQDRMEVWQAARQQLGDAPIYVQTVEYPPRVYKMPSRKVVAYVGL
jgi:PHD/YefM family antitoxin component YafN of YafNO toxin-antitoxin module